MQWLNATYTRRYNVRQKTYDHLFQGRYKALLVDGDVPAERWNSEAVEEAEKARAERLLAQGLKAFKVKDVRELAALDRYLLARWVRQHSRVTVGWLAQVMGLETRGGMASSIHLAGCRLRTDRRLAARWKQLEKYDID